MADKKITQLTNITGANLVDADEFVVVDISADETKAITLGELKEAFDSGSGFVRITGDTMTGPLDVQSTITSDGLTVDGVNDIVFSSGGNNVRSDGTLQIQADADGSGTGVLRLRTKSKTRQQIDNNGDISFYEDTGTTPKFFWDASAEGLNIGATSVPFGRLDISDVGGSGSSTIFDTGANGDNYFTAGTSGIQVFRNGSTERMRIDSSGNVGIGNTAPDGNLTIGDTSTSGDVSIRIKGDATSRGFVMFGDTGGAQLGDIMYDHSTNHMRFRVNNSERMRIDSSGNVGIGTSSPDTNLNISSSSTNGPTIRLENSDTAVASGEALGSLEWYSNDASTGGTGVAASIKAIDVNTFGTAYGIALSTGSVSGGVMTNAERMRIDSSGNVGIGTSSPSASINKFIQVYQPSTGNAGIKLNAGSTTGFDFIQNQLGESFIYNRDNSYLAFGTNNSERMRLDSSGNLLVGKTSFDATATGSILSNNGELWVTRSDSTPVYIRRLSTDGTLIQFNKDGTTVGSIGVQSSADLTIGSGTSGFSFSSAGNAIVPNNPATNTYRDAAINLGYSGGRFKDGYFSGTVNAASFSGDGSNLTGISGTSGTPAGAVIYHAGSTPPTGFIKANGASLSTTTYADLFAAIGYTYGGSGGSFNVPDLRGEFLRGWDDARGVDSGRTLGSAQADELRSHSHAANVFDEGYSGGGGQGDHWHSSISNKSNTTTIQATGGNETRPRNIALLACIKY